MAQCETCVHWKKLEDTRDTGICKLGPYEKEDFITGRCYSCYSYHQPPAKKCLNVGEMFRKLNTDDIEMIVAVCPYCSALRKNVLLTSKVQCHECGQRFKVGKEVISVRIKVKGVV